MVSVKVRVAVSVTVRVRVQSALMHSVGWGCGEGKG